MSKKNKKDYTMYENTEPKCPHFGFCGGCSLQKITYDRQLEIKAGEVKSLLDSVYGSVNASAVEKSDAGCINDGVINNGFAKTLDGKEGYLFEGIIPSPVTEGYRNKMEFTFGDEYKDGPFALGLHEKGSFMNIVNITDCCLIHPDLNKIRNLIRDYFNEYFERGEILFHNNKTHQGWLRHLLLRRASKTGEILVALVTSSDISSGVAECNNLKKTCCIDAEQSVSINFDNKNGLMGNASLYMDLCERNGSCNLTDNGITAGDMYADRHVSSDGNSINYIDEQEVLKNLLDKLRTLDLDGTLAGFVHIINDSFADAVKADKIDVLYGRDYIYEQVLNLKFKISVFSFFQTNTLGAEVLYSKAREYAGDAHGLLFDLYSGTGTIAQLMAPAVEKVVGVEIVGEAVEAAKENAKLNGIENAEFIAADVLKALDVIGKPDSLILDPPREGINPKALGKILSWGVESVVYVSCKPTSLARDLGYFKIAGYELKKACCVDMFPGTEHVECVVLLTKHI